MKKKHIHHHKVTSKSKNKTKVKHKPETVQYGVTLRSTGDPLPAVWVDTLDSAIQMESNDLLYFNNSQAGNISVAFDTTRLYYSTLSGSSTSTDWHDLLQLHTPIFVVVWCDLMMFNNNPWAGYRFVAELRKTPTV